MTTWNWYIGPDNRGYWSMSAPYMVSDMWVASIERDQRPDKTLYEMQSEQVIALGKYYNPYQG